MTKASFSLWDTAGQEDLKNIRLLAYDKTDILLITFSIIGRNSFRNVKDLWFKELEKNRSKFTNAKVRREDHDAVKQKTVTFFRPSFQIFRSC